MPAVSIVMPVFNRADTVGRAIESVLGQTFSDFELLIINDGSTDGSEAVIARHVDQRIRYLLNPKNKGGNASRNAGIRAAQSAIVCFIDSDDEFLPHKLGHIVSFFQANPDIGVLIDSFEVAYPSEMKKANSLRNNPVLRGSLEVERAIFARRIFKATPALSARRNALLDAGLFDETLRRRQDMDMILRLTRKAICATTNEVLWTKHWTPESISAKQNTFMDATIEICKRHPEYLQRADFRVGLSRDLARHFIRLSVKGHLITAFKDAGRFARFAGKRSLVGLVSWGLVETLRRRAARQ
jgi:glycosyltransferase involved in cell wall biosynthesis